MEVGRRLGIYIRRGGARREAKKRLHREVHPPHRHRPAGDPGSQGKRNKPRSRKPEDGFRTQPRKHGVSEFSTPAHPNRATVRDSGCG